MKMINLGYKLIKLEKYEEAIVSYKLNVSSYPNYSNAFSSLCEAYMLNGNDDLAVVNFEKALELYPNNNRAKQKLNLLTRKTTDTKRLPDISNSIN